MSNGTFESSTTGWFTSPTSTSSLARVSGGHTGAYSARIKNGGTSATTIVLNDSTNTVRSTVAGTTYEASAWVRTTQPNVSIAVRTMEFAGSTNVAATQTAKYITDTAWHRLTVRLKAVRSGSTVDLNVLAWDLGAGRTFDVDDVTLSTVSTTTTTTTSASATSTSTAASAVLPAQGKGALFGYYQSGGADVRPMESKVGRKFDLVHYYKDANFGSNPWPAAKERADAAQGRTVHITWELASYNGSYDSSVQPAPAKSAWDAHSKVNRKIWTYNQILNGSMNRYLDATADRVKSTPYTWIVDINHEMDDLPDVGGSNTQRAAAGTRAEYKAAYRYIVDRFRARGVKNVVWAWMVSGWYAADSSKTWSLQQLWPGSSHVDMIMWDPYNYRRDNWKTFSQTVGPFYRAVKGGLLDKVDPNAKYLPMGLGEYGCVADSRRPAWLRSIPTELRSFPGIVSLGYYSSGSWGALHDDSAAVSAFAEAGRHWYLKTRG